MPELPEVESVRLGLAAHLPGRTVTGVHVVHPRSVRQFVAPDAVPALLTGRAFCEPRRRGKYLWLPFDDSDALLAHLGMSGQFRISAPDAEVHRHTRVVLDLDDGQQLRFVDQRMFGGLGFSAGGADLPPEYGHVALDPFEDAFDPAAVARRMRQKRSAIKRVLLDQGVVSGFGNIYADEALWRAKLHGEQPANSLSQRAVVGLLQHGRAVMGEALDAGGTSFDALYVHVNGESGYFDRSLDAYGREGLPCKRCGTPMKRIQFTNRSSTFCPRCQRLRGRACPAANVAP